jgi:hypothetical protein
MESRSGGLGRLDVLRRPSLGRSEGPGGGGTVADDITAWEVPSSCVVGCSTVGVTVTAPDTSGWTFVSAAV